MQIEIKKTENRIEAGRGPSYDIIYCKGKLKIIHWIYKTTKYRELKETLEITVDCNKDLIPETDIAIPAASEELRFGYKPYKVVYRGTVMEMREHEFEMYLKSNQSLALLHNMANNIISDMIDSAQQVDAPDPGSNAYFQIYIVQNSESAGERIYQALSEIRNGGIEIVEKPAKADGELIVYNVYTPMINVENEKAAMKIIKEAARRQGCQVRFRFPSFLFFRE